MGKFFGILGVFSLIVLIVAYRSPQLFGEVQKYLHFGQMEVTELNQRVFQNKVLISANKLREPVRIDPVQPDSEVQQHLSDYLGGFTNPSDVELEQLFAYLQNKLPGAQFISANICYSPTDQGLLELIEQWEDITNPDYESLSCVVIPNGARLGCVAVLTSRLPEFSLSAANGEGGRFYNRCPHCLETHAVELDRKARTLILSCPECKRPYDVLASDTKGSLRRANEFLLGFRLPDRSTMPFKKDDSSEDRILQVWKAVVEHCEYQLDNARSNQQEAWKLPDETWLERTGDCEDTSILLVDSLISAGFQARVAVGWHENIGQHAWCVVRNGEDQYLLESTLQEPANLKLVPVANAAAEYHPEQLFDRDHLFFKAQEKAPADDNYWAESLWEPVFSKPSKSAAATAQVSQN